jgi:tyrosinase
MVAIEERTGRPATSVAETARAAPRAAPPELGDLLDRMRLSRRQLLKLGAAGSLALALASCTKEAASQIANRPMRRDIASLPLDDPIIAAYKTAVKAMQDLPASDKRNWTKQAEIHQNFCPHGNWLFLPWHRAYLKYFEDICRQLSGKSDFALPYWNWSKDLKIPPVFWESGSILNYSPRTATASTIFPSSIFGPPNIEAILDETNFLLFASGSIPLASSQRTPSSQGPLESGPHNTAHGIVGGTMGSYMSPLDPIFWTHHNVIDAIWVDWNIKRGNPNTNSPDWMNRTFTEFCDKDGNSVTVTMLEVILYPYFTYRFDNPMLGV